MTFITYILVVVIFQSWTKRHSTDPTVTRCQVPRWQKWSHSSGFMCPGLISAFTGFYVFWAETSRLLFSFHVAFRVDTEKPVRFSFNITPGSSWPSSRWHRMATLKRAWYSNIFLTVLINQFDPVYWFKSVCVFLCMCVASAGPGACVSAEWYSLPEDLDEPCWSGHNQWTQTSQVSLYIVNAVPLKLQH